MRPLWPRAVHSDASYRVRRKTCAHILGRVTRVSSTVSVDLAHALELVSRLLATHEGDASPMPTGREQLRNSWCMGRVNIRALGTAVPILQIHQNLQRESSSCRLQYCSSYANPSLCATMG